MDSAREAVGWLERHATYTRTGHHSARTGEWRDGDGLAASLFLHHLSRDGDPQLHVHVAIWNRVQRADGADDKWRTLDSRTLHNQRLGVAPVADRILETRLSALGLRHGAPGGRQRRRGRRRQPGRHGPVQLPRRRRHRRAGPARPGVRRRCTASRRAARTLWLLHQQAGQNTRRTKAEARRTIAGQTGTAEPTAAQRLAAWEAQTVRREVHALSAVHEQVARVRRRARRGVHRPCWMMRPSARPRGSRSPRCKSSTRSGRWRSSGSRCTGRCPVLKPGADGEAVVTEVARLAVSGRAGAEVVQVTAPDLTDVTSLGVRASDGGSIYRPPNEERYCTLAHLDTEEQILAAAKRTVPQLVSHEQARAAAERTGLNGEQRDAVVMMLTAADGDDGADRPGRGGQEPHHGRVRPAVDHASPAGGSSA